MQAPVQDPKTLPRTGRGKAEPLPGLPGLRQGPLRCQLERKEAKFIENELKIKQK